MPTKDPKRERPVDPTLRAVGARIKSLMLTHPTMSKQGDLAKAAKINRSSLSHILSGKQAASVLQLQAIARVLGVPLEDIVPPENGQPAASPGPTATPTEPEEFVSIAQVFADYVAKHKNSLTENEIKGLLDGSYQLDDVVPDEQAITDFLRAKRALLERLRRRPGGG